MSTATPAICERDAIARTIQRYVEGGKTGRTDEMKRAFHPGATIFGHLGSELFGGPIQLLFDWNDQNGAATELEAQIISVDVMESIATVRLELDNWSGRRFTDMFTLLQVDGEWKIISKVFYLHPEGN
jgi:hypothetical protein